jgi:hypothetical protein
VIDPNVCVLNVAATVISPGGTGEGTHPFLMTFF